MSNGPLAPNRLSIALKCIEGAPAAHWSVDRLAQAVHLSPFHFSRAFKAATGKSPHAYLVQRRMELAQRLLRETKMTIREISERVGIANPAHFTSTFKRAFGATPRAYRLAHLRDDAEGHWTLPPFHNAGQAFADLATSPRAGEAGQRPAE